MLGHNVVIATTSGCASTHYKSVLKERGIDLWCRQLQRGNKLRVVQFDLVIFSCFWWHFTSVFEEWSDYLRMTLPHMKQVALTVSGEVLGFACLRTRVHHPIHSFLSLIFSSISIKSFLPSRLTHPAGFIFLQIKQQNDECEKLMVA